MIAARRLVFAALLCAAACSQRIEVLGPRLLEDGAADASGSDPPDAAIDASRPLDPCGGCATSQLCAADMCVASAGIRSLDSHFRHTCMVRDGHPLCWGDNEHGELGVGDQAARHAPAPVGTATDWLAISTGEQHTCGLRAPGKLYCWGRNHKGQLGTGDSASRKTPAPVASARVWRSVACGGDSCCAIDTTDQLHCWGDNSEGKLGQLDWPGPPQAAEPVRVDDTRWRRVDVGQGHVCAIREGGTLHCWGRNTAATLGIGPEPEQMRGPTRVGDANDWIDVSGSQHSSCGVRASGALFCWGLNTSFEVGSPTIDELIAVPRRVGTDDDWAAVATGWFHTCGQKRTGTLWCWGRAIEGQLGQGGGEPVEPPTQIPTTTFERFALGSFHSCGVTTEGKLQCWGANDRGQLGVGDTERRYEPAPIAE